MEGSSGNQCPMDDELMKTLNIRGLYFSAGQRIPGHPTCHRPHGHTYFIDVTYVPRSDILDDMGMIIDFGELKDKVKDYLKNRWDHMTIIQNTEDEVAAWEQLFNTLGVHLMYLKKLRYTTAEYMQEIMIGELEKIFPDAERIIVDLYEGPMQGIGEI